MPRREVLKFRRCLSGGDGFAEELRGHPEPAAEAVAEDVKIVGAAYHRLPQSSRSLAAFDVGKGEAGRRLNRLDLGIFNLSVLRDEEVRRLGIVVDGTATVEAPKIGLIPKALRSEEHTSELQSLMRISYAVFCLKNKNELRL